MVTGSEPAPLVGDLHEHRVVFGLDAKRDAKVLLIASPEVGYRAVHASSIDAGRRKLPWPHRESGGSSHFFAR